MESAWGQNRPIERAAAQIRRSLGMAEEEPETERVQDRRDEEEEPEGDTTPFGVDLQEIHLIAHQDRATMDPSLGSDSVVIGEGVLAPPGIEEMLEPFVGEPMSMDLLSKVGKEVVKAWREYDYPIVDVYFPEQNITQGKLQIVALESVLGKKETEGGQYSREDYLLSNLRIEPGDRINKKIVAADIHWLNENPIRSVNLVYERGEEDGTTDVVLDVTEKSPVSAYVNFANTGVAFTGEEEWSLGFTLKNPGKREHTFGYNYTTDLEWDNLEAHSVFYEAFLPWRHMLQIGGAYVTSQSVDTSVTDTRGLSRQLSLIYRIPLDRPEFNPAWKHYFSFGFDYKSTNTDQLFGGVNIFDSDIAVGQFRAFYEFSVPDEKGRTRAKLGVVGSPGDWFEHNDDASFNLARLDSSASYFYVFGEFERIQNLPADFVLRWKVRGRASGNRLPSTEQLLAGGYNTVRGFDESVIRGDSGFVSNLELITPAFSWLHHVPGMPCGEHCKDSWNALVFYDAAAMDISDAFAAEVGQSLQSVGVGINGSIGERGYVRASYGWALDSHGLIEPAESGKFHFGVTLSY